MNFYVLPEGTQGKGTNFHLIHVACLSPFDRKVLLSILLTYQKQLFKFSVCSLDVLQGYEVAWKVFSFDKFFGWFVDDPVNSRYQKNDERLGEQTRTRNSLFLLSTPYVPRPVRRPPPFPPSYAHRRGGHHRAAGPSRRRRKRRCVDWNSLAQDYEVYDLFEPWFEPRQFNSKVYSFSVLIYLLRCFNFLFWKFSNMQKSRKE